MKKVVPVICAFVLFALTCVGIDIYDKWLITSKAQDIIYYNTDDRNFSKYALGAIITDGAIPVFGSSELSASDNIAYPPALFHNGNSDFNMVLIGRGSMQSLHHAITLGAISNMIPDKKVVLIISPQWFTSGHLSSEAYASRFSERMYVDFLKNSDISYETKSYVSERVISLLTSDPQTLERVEKYEKIYLAHSLNPLLRIEMGVYNGFMNIRQNFLFQRDILDRKVNDQEWVQAEKIDFDALLSQAEEAGELACTNNEFGVYDEYFDRYIKEDLDANKDSNMNASYLQSPEYNDLCIFLEVCRQTGIEPLIVSVPVNGYWYDYTGFSQEDRNGYYQKIRDICDEYQVQIADFSNKEYEKYFLRDVMHLGWKGWVYLDETVYEFSKEAE